MKHVPLIMGLVVAVSLCGLCGCRSAKPSFSRDDGSRVQRLGLQVSSDAEQPGGETIPAVAEAESSASPALQQADATNHSRWTRWWERLRAPKRIPLPLSETETADDAPVELGAATDFDSF